MAVVISQPFEAPAAIPIFASLLLTALGFVYYITNKFSRKLPLPPGPSGSVPFVGVLFDIPKQQAYLKFQEWAKEFGPIYCAQIGRTRNIFLSDGSLARELLDKRSKIYSDRPPSVVGDTVSQGTRSVLMPYNARWRGVRKLFASVLTPAKCDGIYTKWGEAEAIVTLKDIVDYPEDLTRNLNRFSMSIVRSVTYSKRAFRRDPLMLDMEEAAKEFVEVFRPGAFIIEYFPWLLKLPRFLQPGMDQLEYVRDLEEKYYMSKWSEITDYHRKHPQRHTIIKDIKKLHEDPGLKAELTDKQCAATGLEIIAVGTDTTAASVLILINALLEYPECLRKAHEELDRVIGQDRYPTWQDQENLPYMRALIKEQQRWRTISPLSMSHYTYVEDEYQGYRIPAGSVVRLNTWAIHHDPERYPEPEKFKPERFLNFPLSASAYANSSDASARDHFSYGSGKRICPGIHLAERNLWNMVSRLVHTFNIEPKMKSDGTLDIPKLEDYRFGLILLPPNFEAKFVIRSEQMKRTLEREFKDTAKEGKLDSWEELSE